MPNVDDTRKIAQAVSMLRPDWLAHSFAQFVLNNRELRERPARDLAVAATWIAFDPQTRTPALLLTPGRWWQAAAGGTDTGPSMPIPPPYVPEPRGPVAPKCATCGAVEALHTPHIFDLRKQPEHQFTPQKDTPR